MHPYHHARSSAKKFGGKWQDYIEVHNWFDLTKGNFADVRHRAMRHHAEGIFWCEEKFGVVIVNSKGREVPTRLIGEQHVKEDCGFIPSMQRWLLSMRVDDWMVKMPESTKPIYEELKQE